MKDTLVKNKQIDVISECVLFIVNHLDTNTTDKDLDDMFFLPYFYEFIKEYLPIITMEKDAALMWNWAVGILLKYTDFPMSKNKVKEVTLGLQMLMQVWKYHVLIK
jgi:hypothetical protein